MTIDEKIFKIYQYVADGYILAVSKKTNEANLIERFTLPTLHDSERIIDSKVVTELLNGRYPWIHKLMEDGEPPISERSSSGGYRLGWREMGFIDDNYDYYCMTQ